MQLLIASQLENVSTSRVEAQMWLTVAFGIQDCWRQYHQTFLMATHSVAPDNIRVLMVKLGHETSLVPGSIGKHSKLCNLHTLIYLNANVVNNGIDLQSPQ